MNKLKRLYKTFLLNWNDNTFYKTSLTKNSVLFKTWIAATVLSVLGLIALILNNWTVAVCFYVYLVLSLAYLVGVYKRVADKVEVGEDE